MSDVNVVKSDGMVDLVLNDNVGYGRQKRIDSQIRGIVVRA